MNGEQLSILGCLWMIVPPEQSVARAPSRTRSSRWSRD